MINFSLKRIFIIGDTSTGKTTSAINEVLESGVPTVFYVTSKKIDLNDKENYVRTHTFGNYKYDTLYHDSERVISLNKFSDHKFHLMTIEKALYYFLNNKLDEKSIIIFDEIDTISQNKNYELLIGHINSNYPNNMVIYISATINKNYLIKKLAKFFMLDIKTPDSIIDMGKFERKVNTRFISVKNYRAELINKIKAYCENPLAFGQTIFIIPSKPYIRKLINSDLTKNMFILRSPSPKIKKYLDKIPKDIKVSPDIVSGLRHNIGIIDALSTHSDREFILSLFNRGLLHLLFSTNVIERGINIVANSIFIFESRGIEWDDNQIINMFGRINRSINTKAAQKSLKLPGHFFLISEKKPYYNFDKIYSREYVIKSILKPSDVYFFYLNDNNIINHLINYFDPSVFSALNQYSEFSGVIKFSLGINNIRRVAPELRKFITAKGYTLQNTSDKAILSRIYMKLESKKMFFNLLRFAYRLLYDKFISGKLTQQEYENKIESLIYSYIDHDVKFGYTSLAGINLVKDEIKIARELATHKNTLESASSIFLFNRRTHK